MIDRFLHWRWLAAALLLVSVAALSPGLQRAMVPDNALSVWFLETDPQLKAYHAFQAHFGNDEVILLSVTEADGIFTPTALARLDRLQQGLTEISGIERVISILSIQDLVDTPQGLSYQALLPRPFPSAQPELDLVRDQATQSLVFLDRLINTDATQAMFWIQMSVMADIDTHRDGIVSAVAELADRELGELPHPMGGIGVIYSALNVITQHDFGLFIGLGYLIMFVMLWWIFRSVRLVLAAVGVIVLGNLASLGVYGLLGYQINMVTVVLPLLIVVLGIADAVHFPAMFFQVLAHDAGLSRYQQVKKTLQIVWKPCLLTTLTTMAGFLALASSPMKVIRDLGIFAAIGIFVSLLASVVLMTLAFFGFHAEAKVPKHRWLKRFLTFMQTQVSQHRLAFGLLSLLLGSMAAWGACLVQVDTYTIGYLPDHHRVVRDHLALESTWGSYAVVDFLIHPAEGSSMEDHELLNGMERFIAAARQMPEVRNGFSLATIYRRMNQVIGADKPVDEAWRADEIAQLSLVIESEDFDWNRKNPEFADNVLAPFTNQDKSLGRLILIGAMQSAKQLERLLGQAEQMAREAMGDIATIEAAGYPPLYVRIIDYVMRSQIRSFFLALAFIFALMLLWLRSLRLALISLVPNVFPVLVIMGVMGAFGIDLDVATATVAAIVMGIAIDDTVHFLHHWRLAEKTAPIGKRPCKEPFELPACPPWPLPCFCWWAFRFSCWRG